MQPNNCADMVNSNKVWIDLQTDCNWYQSAAQFWRMTWDVSVCTGCSVLMFSGHVKSIVFSMRLERTRGTAFFNPKDFWDNSFWFRSMISHWYILGVTLGRNSISSHVLYEERSSFLSIPHMVLPLIHRAYWALQFFQTFVHGFISRFC